MKLTELFIEESHEDHSQDSIVYESEEITYMLDMLNEVSYSGNIGVMELVKFGQVASHQDQLKLKQLIAQKKNQDAWRLIQNVLGVQLQGKEFGNQ